MVRGELSQILKIAFLGSAASSRIGRHDRVSVIMIMCIGLYVTVYMYICCIHFGLKQQLAQGVLTPFALLRTEGQMASIDNLPDLVHSHAFNLPCMLHSTL